MDELSPQAKRSSGSGRVTKKTVKGTSLRPGNVGVMIGGRDRSADDARDTGAPIALRGEYDLARRAELERSLAGAELSKVAILDLSSVSYMDSTALAVLVRLRKRMSARGSATIRLVAPQPNIRRLLALTELDQVFEIHERMTTALE